MFSLLIAHAARICLTIAYAPLRLLPRRRKVVLISREHHHAPGDFVDIAEALRRDDPSVKVVMLVRMVPESLIGKISYIGHLASQLYHVATARVLIVDTYSMVVSLPRHDSGLTVIQIWHALGALKKFGRSILGTPEGRDRRLANAMRMHRGYDVILASGAGCRPAYAEAFGADIDRVVVAPLPRVDRLLDPARAAATRERIFAAHPQLRSARVAVFAPTLRIDDAIPIDAEAMSAALADIGFHLVVKAHPLMADVAEQPPPPTDGRVTHATLCGCTRHTTGQTDAIPSGSCYPRNAIRLHQTHDLVEGDGGGTSRTGDADGGTAGDTAGEVGGAIVDTADGFSTQDLLQVAEVFITDYSSALYEAAVLGLPCYFLAPDLEEYTSSRNFYLDYRHDLPGPIVANVAELAAAIAAGRGTAEASRAFGARWVQLPDHADQTAQAKPSSTPCTDAIAALILAHTG